MQYMNNVALIRAPCKKLLTNSQVPAYVNQWMKHITHKSNVRRILWITLRNYNTKLENARTVIAFMNKQYSVPDYIL